MVAATHLRGTALAFLRVLALVRLGVLPSTIIEQWRHDRALKLTGPAWW